MPKKVKPIRPKRIKELTRVRLTVAEETTIHQRFEESSYKKFSVFVRAVLLSTDNIIHKQERTKRTIQIAFVLDALTKMEQALAAIKQIKIHQTVNPTEQLLLDGLLGIALEIRTKLEDDI